MNPNFKAFSRAKSQIIEKIWAIRGFNKVRLLKNFFLILPFLVYLYLYPFSNFLAWFIISTILALFVYWLVGKKFPLNKPAKLKIVFLPLALYQMNLFLFMAVNFSHGFFLAGIIGSGVFGIFILARLNKTPKKDLNL